MSGRRGAADVQRCLDLVERIAPQGRRRRAGERGFDFVDRVGMARRPVIV